MDAKLLAWARAVKVRRRDGRPTLWVFTDRDRLPDPAPVIRRLPPGLCGVVLRPGPADTAAFVRQTARLCRAHRVSLSVAGPLARDRGPWAWRHLSRGGGHVATGSSTGSAHGRAELVAARRAGVGLVFLSPLFPTASHPGAASLGSCRWQALARGCRMPVLALGGVAPATLAGVPDCAGVGLVGAAL